MQTFLGGARGSLFTRMGFVVIHDKTVDEWGTAVHGYFMTEPPAVVDMELNLDLHRTSIPGAQMRGTRATRHPPGSIRGMTGLAHGSDITVLQNHGFSTPSSPDDGFDHNPCQVVGPNHLMGEQRAKYWID